uniref:Uncharacterized protein n=1 Tax=Arundo donax TaxID=35708 RepID=A0A0A8XWT0_ARUDO
MARKARPGSGAVGWRKRAQRCGVELEHLVPLLIWAASRPPPSSRSARLGWDLVGRCGEDGDRARQQGRGAAGSARALSPSCRVGGEEQELDAASVVLWRRARVDTWCSEKWTGS